MNGDSVRAFLAMLDEISPGLAKAFEAAVSDLRSAAQIGLIEDAISRGDVEAAVRALNISPEFYAPLDRMMERAFLEGALYQMGALPDRPFGSGGGQLVIRFDGRNPRAEAWVRKRSSTLITEVVEDQKEAVRIVARAGIEAGKNPRSTALEIVGRRQPSGKRSGGILGLHSSQAAYVANARAELSDPEQMANYFTRKRRDKRFDRTVAKALREGKPIARADIERITDAYSGRLLKLRGDTIGRTETLAALHAGRLEGVMQLVDTGKVSSGQVQLVWDATGDARTRSDHMAMEGQTVQLGQPFVAPDGSRLMHPGDPTMGANGAQVINCRCYMRPKIDWLAGAI